MRQSKQLQHLLVSERLSKDGQQAPASSQQARSLLNFAFRGFRMKPAVICDTGTGVIKAF